MKMINKIITELQSLGAKTENESGHRKGGAGPAEGCTLIIKGIPLTIPVKSSFASDSPYTMKKKNGKYVLYKARKELFFVDIVPKPKFYDYTTRDGISYNQIALLHGRDCLATTVIQKCIYWNTDKRCKFCGIELSLNNKTTIERKTAEQLVEVAKVAKEIDNVKHIVLTSGTNHSLQYGIKYLSNCVRSIKCVTNLPIHVQIEPPSDSDVLVELKEAGVDTIGIHIESFDFKILKEIAPVKAVLGLKRYSRAWEKSVDIFGINQVSSFLIAGLGEGRKSIIDGSIYLAERGVYPFLVPLRPIPGSLLHDALPPPPELMIELYEEISQILKRSNVSSKKNKAGCVRCGACSALPEFES
jgi:radical SAM protein (TIGR04043 family)